MAPADAGAASGTGRHTPHRVGGRARGRGSILRAPQFALARGDRCRVAVVAERPDEGVELGDLLFALLTRPLNLVGQLLELFERRALIEGSSEWLRLSRICHRLSS